LGKKAVKEKKKGAGNGGEEGQRGGSKQGLVVGRETGCRAERAYTDELELKRKEKQKVGQH